MKMLPSIIVTALIVTGVWLSVWSSHWAQPESLAPKPSVTPQSKGGQTAAGIQNGIKLPLSLVGISSRSDYNDIDTNAYALFSQFSESGTLLNQLKDQPTLELYLIYQPLGSGDAQQNWQISAGVSAGDLNQIPFEKIHLPKGAFEALSKAGSQTSNAKDAWENIDSDRAISAVIERYRLDSNGAVISNDSLVSYK